MKYTLLIVNLEAVFMLIFECVESCMYFEWVENFFSSVFTGTVSFSVIHVT